MAVTLSADTIQQLRAQMDQALASTPVAPMAAAMGAPAITLPAGVNFCGLWPVVKVGLQAASVFIPGGAAIVNILIGIGDQIYSTTCNK